MKLFAPVYGLLAYLIFFGSFLYAIGFVEGVAVPKTIDSGAVAPTMTAVIIDLALLGLFAVQHSLMARPAFKAWWTRIVPQPVERSTYVLFSSLILLLLCWQWRPLPQAIWTVTGVWGQVLTAVSWLGFGIVLLSTFLLSHFELFGLSQVWSAMTGRTMAGSEFRTPLLYKVTRHPLYLGFVLAFWAAPVMSAGHLLFALATTGYILIAIQFEERDLIAAFGERYVAYRRTVSMLIPLPPRKGA
jgi:protein-S-isoprenylcysteine O-methyltransferase Ste14